MTINVLIADDHEVVRTGLSSMLADEDIKITAEASNGAEAVKLAKKHRPDVVLMDIRMGDSGGLDALSEIHEKSPNVKVIMLSTYDNPTYIAQAVARGAADYVLKGSSRKQLVEAITKAVEKTGPIKSSPFREMAGLMRTRVSSAESAPLTRREEQVLRHIAFGLSNKEIAQSLEISVETVKEHVQNVLRKISVADRTQAAVWAVRKGMVA